MVLKKFCGKKEIWVKILLGPKDILDRKTIFYRDKIFDQKCFGQKKFCQNKYALTKKKREKMLITAIKTLILCELARIVKIVAPVVYN